MLDRFRKKIVLNPFSFERFPASSDFPDFYYLVPKDTREKVPSICVEVSFEYVNSLLTNLSYSKIETKEK